MRPGIASLNNFFDGLARPDLRLFGRPRSAFRVCGIAGLFAGFSAAFALGAVGGLSLPLIAVLGISCVLTFLALGMFTKLLRGEESLTYYHQQVAAMSAAATLLWVLRKPILPYMDLVIVGVGTLLVFGRAGCLLVGCCHGRPLNCGVRYGTGHAAAGFPSYLVGVRFFPVQALEGVYVLCAVLFGAALALPGHQPGEALAWYVVAYGVGRFFFEFWRGDAARPYWLGFSEAQWTSLVLVGCAVVAEARAILPLHLWHAGAFLLLVLVAAAVSVHRRLRETPLHKLLHPRHVSEIAEAIDALSRCAAGGAADFGSDPSTSVISIASTSLGIQISMSVISDADGPAHHYALSCRAGRMTDGVALALARLILRLRHPSASCEMVRGSEGVFHALVRARVEGRAESWAMQNLNTREGRHAF